MQRLTGGTITGVNISNSFLSHQLFFTFAVQQIIPFGLLLQAFEKLIAAEK
jgi:hypothetical protein